jgi:voltage-gated potassium channel
MRDRFNAFTERHEMAWELGMGFLAIIYVAVGFSLDAASPDVAGILLPLETTLTVIFVAEFASRVGASRDRPAYLRGHWIDVLALIPVARGLRVARLLRVLRLTRFFAGSYRAIMRAERMRGSQGIARVIVAWSTVTVISCIAFYAVEAGENPAIHGPLDALWWGITTLSTVGYGDIIPVTPEGRLVSGALMLLGIGLFGAITAIATNTLLSSTEAEAHRPVDDLERLDALHRSSALTHDEFAAAKRRVLARL